MVVFSHFLSRKFLQSSSLFLMPFIVYLSQTTHLFIFLPQCCLCPLSIHFFFGMFFFCSLAHLLSSPLALSVSSPATYSLTLPCLVYSDCFFLFQSQFSFSSSCYSFTPFYILPSPFPSNFRPLSNLLSCLPVTSLLFAFSSFLPMLFFVVIHCPYCVLSHVYLLVLYVHNKRVLFFFCNNLLSMLLLFPGYRGHLFILRMYKLP